MTIYITLNDEGVIKEPYDDQNEIIVKKTGLPAEGNVPIPENAVPITDDEFIMISEGHFGDFIHNGQKVVIHPDAEDRALRKSLLDAESYVALEEKRVEISVLEMKDVRARMDLLRAI